MRFIPLIFLLLAGCTSYEQRVAASCERLGMGPGTNYYPSCVQQRMELDQRDRAMWAGVTAAGVSTFYQPAPVLVVTH